MSSDQRRLEAFQRWTATGCVEALLELDQLALRAGEEASITETAMRGHLARLFVAVSYTEEAVRDIRGTIADGGGGSFYQDDAAWLVVKAMTDFPAQEFWSVSILMEVLRGRVSETTVRKALAFMVPGFAGESSVLVTHGKRPVFYALREVSLSEEGCEEAARLVKSPRAYSLGLFKRRNRFPFAPHATARKLRRATEALRQQRAAPVAAPIDDTLNYCAAC